MSDQAPPPPASAEQKVGMGELCVRQGTGVLKTLLGSCIGLVLHDSRNRVGGLAHIVLPSTNGEQLPLGKYADTAIPELIRQIEQAGGKSRHLSAKFAGGANMFATANLQAIGTQNIVRVTELLAARGIPVTGQHCGGQQGRRMAYDVQTGKVTVEIMGQSAVEL